VRFKLADGENGPVLSGWVQPPDNNKGTRSRWLPQVGSQHLVMQFPGGSGPSTFVPMSHHDASPNPASDADDTVIYDDGACRISVRGGTVQIKAGGSSIVLADGEITLSSNLVKSVGASLKHNAKEVGDTHLHTGVMPGGGLTGVPS
jgi:phage baseplate assembly protein gpV